jgi:hypothetical protein
MSFSTYFASASVNRIATLVITNRAGGGPWWLKGDWSALDKKCFSVSIFALFPAATNFVWLITGLETTTVEEKISVSLETREVIRYEGDPLHEG